MFSLYGQSTVKPEHTTVQIAKIAIHRVPVGETVAKHCAWTRFVTEKKIMEYNSVDLNFDCISNSKTISPAMELKCIGSDLMCLKCS